jgi:voltage-gated potassium channel
VARLNLIERRMNRFMREPVSVRNAANAMVTATALVVVGSGILMWILDHKEYPNVGRGMWWAIQTVTTVGYGDVTPGRTAGRIVATVVMLWGVAFLAILFATITSTFVARAEQQRAEQHAAEELSEHARIEERFDDLAARLERVEAVLTQLAGR